MTGAAAGSISGAHAAKPCPAMQHKPAVPGSAPHVPVQLRPRVRRAVEADVPLLYSLIRDLAAYEDLLDRFVCTPAALSRELFTDKLLGAAIVELPSGPGTGSGTGAVGGPGVSAAADESDAPHRVAGFALWYYNFSTFRGKRGLYLEDLFVRPEFRGKGCGRALLSWVAGHARATDCFRVDWSVLSWNESAKAFYRTLGAAPVAEWEWWRLKLD